MLLRPEDKDAVGNIFLVYRDNYILVFKIANMGKYIFKKILLFGRFFSGLTICINAVAGEADEKYILKVLKDNIRFTMVTELFIKYFYI